MIRCAILESVLAVDSLIKFEWKFNLTAKDFLLLYPPGSHSKKLIVGVYTVMRTIGQSRIVEMDMHMKRLTDGILKSMDLENFRSNALDLKRTSLLVDQKFRTMITQGMSEFSNVSFPEYKITALLYPRDDSLAFAVHIDEFKPVPNDVGVQVEVHGFPRMQANVKNSQWLRDRESITKNDKKSHEIILEHEGNLYEGLTSNLMIIARDGCIQTAPLDVVLPGTIQKIVFEVARRNNVHVKYAFPTLADITTSLAVFLTSTSRILVPVDKLVYHGKTHLLSSSSSAELISLRTGVVDLMSERACLVKTAKL